MVNRTPRPLTERLWPRTVRDVETGCLVWQGAVDPNGYGNIGLGSRAEGHEKTHRVAYRLANGPIPPGLHVLHRCDRRACIEPTHLFLGTHAENMADMAAKGRARPPASPRKLTDEQVVAIRATNEHPASVAAEFGISAKYVSALRRFERRQTA